MKRWEILIWVLLAALAVWAVFHFASDSEEGRPPATATVNPNARLAGSGSPLPAPAWEDLVVEQQQFDGRIFVLSYDIESGNWQLDFFQQGSQSLRYIAEAGIFLYYNVAETVWDEVDPNLLHDEIRQLTDIDDIILSASQLDAFSRLAVEDKSAGCSQDTAALCAVWTARSFAGAEEVVIYVNKQTRKIDHIVTLNPADPASGAIVTNYYYRPVEIGLPPLGEVRFLADG
ncbi:hypothetical protein F4X86_01135 [Candidatus Saccharibacteria bacterium]|nr:hypothetical protein [Candidatus Saccharibacteria bacterium]